MKIPYSVLKNFIPNLNIDVYKVADLYTMRSYEVEKVEDLAQGLDHVVVGSIIEINPHPNADKLQITKVDVGGDLLLTIVCGANNISVGQKVPVAMIGAVLPGNFEIKETKIRGEISQGMLCSKKELGLDDDSQGIFILGEQREIGALLSEILNLNDAIIEIDNKGLGTRAGDSSSFYGLARELSVIIEKPLISLPKVKLPKPSVSPRKIHRDSSICSYYSLIEVKGLSSYEFNSNVFSKENYRVDLYVQVDKYTLDEHIRHILHLLGYSTGNASVDLSNYIMEEIGQPIHVFDSEKIVGDDIFIRKAEKGESMIDLNDNELILEEGDIVICDSEKIIALAGIIGAKSSSVDDGTQKIIIESAQFNSNQIRLTARRLKLLTNAAKRFERGIPDILAKEALERIGWFLKEGKLEFGNYYTSGVIESTHKVVELDYDYVRKYLGVEISNLEIEKILRKLSVEIKHSQFTHKNILTAPYWRVDLNTQEEYIEEIARMYGYENITPKLDLDIIVSQNDIQYDIQKHFAQNLKNLNYTEVITYPYTNQESYYQMLNPIDNQKPYLRETLTKSLIEVRNNNKHNIDSYKLFEISHVFGEEEGINLALTQHDKSKISFDINTELYQDLLKVSSYFGINISLFDFIEKSKYIEIIYNKVIVGSIYKEVCEISLSKLLLLAEYINEQYSNIPKYPIVKRDITLNVAKEITVKEVYDKLLKIKSDLCINIIFKGSFTKDNMNNYTFHLQFQDHNKSLMDKDVNLELEKMLKAYEYLYE